MDRSRRSASGRPAGPARTGPGATRAPRSAPAGRRGSSRPAGRRAGSPGPEPATPAGRSLSERARRAPGGLTGRAAVLGLVVCALVLSLAYPTKEFLAQRGEIGRLQQEQRDVAARVAALEERKKQLDDPVYVRAQARKRLQYVLPGETVYVVVSPTPAPGDAEAKPDLPQVGKNGAWYGRLWGTVRAADGVPAP